MRSALCCFVRKNCGNDIFESVRHRPLGVNKNLREMYVRKSKGEEIAYISIRVGIRVLFVCALLILRKTVKKNLMETGTIRL